MRLTETLKLLSEARRYVKAGEQCVRKQRKFVERLNRKGADDAGELVILELLEEMQEQYLAHQTSLERQLISILKAD